MELFEIEPAVPRPQDFAREAEVVGSLAGFLTAALPQATIDLEPRFGGSVSLRPDMVVSMGQQRVLLEVKRAPQQFRALQRQYLAQIAHYIAASGIKEAIVYIHSEDRAGQSVREEHELPGVGARVIVISRA